jgi:hypothetical protein
MKMAQDREILIPIAELNQGDKAAQLTLTTSKHNFGINSSAAVEFHHADGGVSFMVFGDFRKTVRLQRGARGTQGNIDKQHAEVFTGETIEALKDEVRRFYANKRTD